MIKIVCTICCFLLGIAASFAQTPQDQFNQAKEWYDKGNNRECIATLQAIERQVGANPRLYSLYTTAYIAEKDFVNAAISLDRFKKLVGNKRTAAIQSILELEKEINTGVETVEKTHKETIAKKRMEEADIIIAKAKKANDQKKAVMLKDRNGQVMSIPNDAVLRVAKDKDGKYGYIDENGTLVVEAKYEMAYPFKDGKALVSLLGKWMHIDRMGNVLSKFTYSNVFQVADKLLGFKEGNLIGFMDASGKVIHQAQFSSITTYNKFIAVGMQNKYGIMDFEGKMIATPQYDQINSFAENMAVVKANGLHGCINSAGKLVVPVKYKYMAEEYREGVIRFSNGGSSGGFLDVNGKIVFEHKYYCNSDFSEGLVKVANDPSGYSIGYLDKTGKLVVSIKFYHGENFSEGLALVSKKKGDRFYIDKTGKEVFKIKTKFLYHSGYKFSDGLARVQVSDDSYSFLDKTGAPVLTLSNYKNVDDFYEGLVCVGNNGLYGFADKSGRVVIPLQFYGPSKFKNGEAIVQRGGDYVVIDKTGKALRKAY